ncbi:MAG: TylF/MycF/NovP-related O-methyltransferase [Thermoleophilaceae bacterium]
MRPRLEAGLRRLGLRPGDPEPPPDLDRLVLDPVQQRIVDQTLPFTITGVARLHALVDAVRYCVKRQLPGAFAECGVWRGGSVMAMLLTLRDLGVEDRDVYLYDTFEGMTLPTEHDVSPVEPPALASWSESSARGERPWAQFFSPEMFDEAAVRRNVLSTGYPAERIHFVRGPVEETIPATAPERLALLRLDTDWYESTRHELVHLYPRLADGGVLIVDDYGHWEGARRACDEYFGNEAAPVLLSRVDYTARLAIKH